jgi:hypothetical protein
MSAESTKIRPLASDQEPTQEPTELTIGTGEHSVRLTRQEVGGVTIYAEPGFEHATTPLESESQWRLLWRKLSK